MGFEVLFHYFEMKDGNYDKENPKFLKKKVGEPFEDVDDNKLASVVMAQMARRDIFVFDVEVYELAKKKVSFASTSNGVRIRNKLYGFDLSVRVEEKLETPSIKTIESSQPIALIEQVKTPAVVKNQIIREKKPIRIDVYDPPKELLLQAKRRGFAFTVGKEYPIFEEKPANKDEPLRGMVYLTKDDNGEKKIMHAENFVSKPVLLENGFVEEYQPSSLRNGVELTFPGEVKDAPLKLR